MRRAARLLLTLPLILGGCAREERDVHGNAGFEGVAEVVRVTDLRPGAPGPAFSGGVYQENRWAVGEGQRLYRWFNCYACHGAGGGGGIGPRLRQGEWIYGSAPEHVYASIMQGRPDGMPAFQGRIDPGDAWKLVAYVRAMDRLTPPDTWPARSDNMSAANPWRRRR